IRTHVRDPDGPGNRRRVEPLDLEKVTYGIIGVGRDVPLLVDDTREAIERVVEVEDLRGLRRCDGRDGEDASYENADESELVSRSLEGPGGHGVAAAPPQESSQRRRRDDDDRNLLNSHERTAGGTNFCADNRSSRLHTKLCRLTR